MRMLFLLVVASCTACHEPVVLAWRLDLGAGSQSTPLVTQDYIAVGTARGLSVAELNGRPRCEYPINSEVVSAPATDGRMIFFGSVNYVFYAITPQCKPGWKFTTGDRIKSDPLVYGDLVYIGSYDKHLYALNRHDGKMVWAFPELPSGENTKAPGDIETGDFSYSSPVLMDGVLYIGNLDHRIYAIDAVSGKMLWRYRTQAAVTSSPRIHEKTLYFGSNDGFVYAVDLRDQKTVWKLETHDWVNSSANIQDDTLYIGSNDKHVYAIATKDGAPRWKFATKGPVISIPAIVDTFVIAADADAEGNIYLFDENNQSIAWTRKTAGPIRSDPVVVDHRFYISGGDRFLYAFDIKTTRR